MPSVTITTGSPDRRMAKPSELVGLYPALTLEAARRWIDRASEDAVRQIGFEPWRQSYTLRLRGSGTGWLPVAPRPIESASLTDIDGGSISDFTIGHNSFGLADRLIRKAGFGQSYDGAIGISQEPELETESDALILTGVLGWLMPGQVGAWRATSVYVATVGSTSYPDATGKEYPRGSWVRSSNPAIQLRFECTTGGTTDATEPAGFASAAAGGTVPDGTVTWTARAAKELPSNAESMALHDAKVMYVNTLERDEVKRHKTADGEVEYFAKPEAEPVSWVGVL